MRPPRLTVRLSTHVLSCSPPIDRHPAYVATPTAIGRQAGCGGYRRYPPPPLTSARLISPGGGTPFLVASPPQSTLDGPCQLLGGAIDRLWEGRRLMAHGHGLKAREAGLQQAAFVVAPAFLAVLVAEVDFHAGDPVGEPAHGTLHHGLDLV